MSRFKGPSVPAPESGGGLPDANVGKILISIDGETWSPQCPLTSERGGWITNDLGILLVVGETA